MRKEFLDNNYTGFIHEAEYSLFNILFRKMAALPLTEDLRPQTIKICNLHLILSTALPA